VTDLSFVENYKEIRKRLNGGGQKAVVIPKTEEVVARKEEAVTQSLITQIQKGDLTRTKILKDPVMRSYLRKSTVLEEGISYREALLKGAEDLPKRMKLLVLPILEESDFSWEELFGKDPVTNRNARTPETVKVKWEIFRELQTYLNMNANQIAAWCKMDHTSVAYGLGTLRKSKR